MPIKNLKGKAYGRLTVVEISGRDACNRVIWRCACACGNEKNVASRHLVNRKIVSCGCFRDEQSRVNGKKGGKKLKGAASHLYKPHLTQDQRIKQRNIEALRLWRRAVFERDGYKCQICGSLGSRLNAHHLDGWAKYPEKRFIVTNGVTLCRSDHKAFHDWLGGARKSCDEKDFEAYKISLTLRIP